MKPYTFAELQKRVDAYTEGTAGLVRYSPGDGVSRYRIVTVSEFDTYGADYFAGRDLCNALGLAECRVMVSAFCAGIDYAVRP